MKKLHWLMAVAAGLLLVSGAVQAQGVIATTKHDLSASVAWGADGAATTTDNGEVCVYCHTPHKANDAAPLWNKTYNSPGPFTVYDSVTVEQTVSQPGAQSLACLSCHDGTVGTDNLANPPGLTAEFVGTKVMLSSNLAYVGEDLSDDHPIGISYAQALLDDVGDFQAVPAQSVLYANVVECATCHSVHDDTNGSFLREDNAGSALCYDCHIK